VLYPPDTETPGFEEENKIKPQECRLVCMVAGHSPQAPFIHA
jgi:hypothetical protein